MSIETAEQLKGMKRAGQVTRLTLDALEAHVRVGMTTAELDAIAAGVTIEPMISAGSGEPVEDRDGWTIRTRDGSLSAHEHTIMITRGAPVILTAA